MLSRPSRRGAPSAATPSSRPSPDRLLEPGADAPRLLAAFVAEIALRGAVTKLELRRVEGPRRDAMPKRQHQAAGPQRRIGIWLGRPQR